MIKRPSKRPDELVIDGRAHWPTDRASQHVGVSRATLSAYACQGLVPRATLIEIVSSTGQRRWGYYPAEDIMALAAQRERDPPRPGPKKKQGRKPVYQYGGAKLRPKLRAMIAQWNQAARDLPHGSIAFYGGACR